MNGCKVVAGTVVILKNIPLCAWNRNLSQLRNQPSQLPLSGSGFNWSMQHLASNQWKESLAD